MKKILFILLSLASFAGYAQTSTFGGIGLRVNDTTTYQTNAAGAHSAGYYDIYFNNQATTKHWDIWNGSSYDHVFDFNSGGAGISDGDKGDITVSGSGATWNIDAGVIGATELATAYNIDQASASTAGATITLDMNSQIQRSFVGSATFASAKAIALSNTTNSLFFNFFFEVTNVAAELTPPSDWLMASSDFDGTDWVPPAIGKYEIGGSFDDTNNLWYVKVSGPFN